MAATVISNWSEERVKKIFSREHPAANWRYEDNDYVIFQNGVFYTRDLDVIKNLIYPRPIFFEVGANDDRSVGVLPLIDNLLKLPQYIGNNSQRLCLHIGPGEHEIFYDKAKIFLSRWLSGKDTGGADKKSVSPSFTLQKENKLAAVWTSQTQRNGNMLKKQPPHQGLYLIRFQ